MPPSGIIGVIVILTFYSLISLYIDMQDVIQVRNSILLKFDNQGVHIDIVCVLKIKQTQLFPVVFAYLSHMS